MRVPDQVQKCVVFFGIEETGKNNLQQLAYRGTGFVVSVQSKFRPEIDYLYLVTAKHVAVKLASKPFGIRANTKEGKAMIFSAAALKWWHHPTDTSTDIAVIPWGPPLNVLDLKTIPTDMFFSEQIRQSTDIGIGDEVFITGLFSRHEGTSKNLPIVRIGNIAMTPDEPISTHDFGDMEVYLIEARSIGGLSGSPVVVREPMVIGGTSRFYLFGLIHGHWDISPNKIRDLGTEDSSDKVSVNMGIAIVTPAQKNLETLNQEGLDKIRSFNDERLKKESAPI